MSLFYRQCDVCLAIGSRNAEYYSHHGVSEKKIFIAPYAVDNKRFINMAEEQKQHRSVHKAQLGIPSNMPVILFASKYTTQKRPGDILKAKKRLESESVECSVVMIGSGEMEPELRDYCIKHELRHVYFLGFMNQIELPRYYAMADVYVLPSEGEAWGLVINEAMCAGVAIIASTGVGAVVDLVKDGINGFTYPAGNVAALTECIRRIVTDPDLATRYGAASRRIIEDWDYEQCVSGVRAALVKTLQSQETNSE
jgi:glycosyltransferase involved in cell wall biosynthesis